MNRLHCESPAFRQALLKSERLRILILSATIGVGVFLRLLRTIISWNEENARAFLWVVLIVAVLAAMEGFVLHAMRSATKAGRDMSRPFWMMNILIEPFLPAVLIAFLSSSIIPTAYRPLVSPAFLVYFILITLSTLRLNPAVSLLCGLACAVSYVLAAKHYGWSLGWTVAKASLFSPEKTVSTYAAFLLLSGLAAAFVAREIRSQVEAALREAETRREVEHLQHDLEVAQSIQRSLLPKSMPQVPGFDIAAWNKPAEQTGGDYYDWQALPDGRVVVVLADVTGHGIGPALLAAVCRAYSRASFGQNQDFLKSMEQINSAIAADVEGGRFVTFVAAIVGSGNAQVELLSAGQAPLFVYWLKHDSFDKMEAQGPPLGISPQLLSDPPEILPFESGDLLVLATDGFFEWTNAAKEQFGSGRLENSVRANRTQPAAGIISLLYQDVLRFAGGTAQKDDLTAIVIKRT
jgi:serine phosphatase RsbU (regulator of sigma subunit)